MATVIFNILEYVHKSLQFCETVQLYKKLLDCPNIIYMVTEIKKPRFEELDIFVFSITSMSIISKTKIFVDIIKMPDEMATYLQSRLFPKLCKKEALMIQILSAILTIESCSQMLEDF